MDMTTLLERLAERYDPDYLVDILSITSEELLEAFEERVWANKELRDSVEDLE